MSFKVSDLFWYPCSLNDSIRLLATSLSFNFFTKLSGPPTISTSNLSFISLLLNISINIPSPRSSPNLLRFPAKISFTLSRGPFTWFR